MAATRIAVIGGGAAGFFAAIAAAQADRTARVVIFEATAHVLTKVRISGGGRCNVTHACFEPRELVKRYPRGSRELIGPLNRFGPRDTIAWFADRGVELKTEADGRMFPTTDDSGTIVDCLRHAAAEAAIEVRMRTAVKSVESIDDEFRLTLSSGDVQRFDAVILTTGGNRSGGGHEIAASLGHTIEQLAPSLFTFQIEDERLQGLEGLAVPDAEVWVPGTKLRERGPVLITHWGLSGPGVLRLSAWGARELAAKDYLFETRVAWAGDANVDRVRQTLVEGRGVLGKKLVANANPFGLPGRLWERLVATSGGAPGTAWNGLPKAAANKLVEAVAGSSYRVIGKSMNKEEFVTCGGVRLREVDFKTLQSKRCPGLFFAGEVLDIDGITGGFNFQSAWTTGWLAGQAASQQVTSPK